MCASASGLFESKDVGDATIVRLTGAKSLDEPTSQSLGAELGEMIAKMAGRKLILDCAEVTYLASGALAVLLTLNKRLRDVGGSLALVNIDPKLYEVFEITKLNTILDIAKNPDDVPGKNDPGN